MLSLVKLARIYQYVITDFTLLLYRYTKLDGAYIRVRNARPRFSGRLASAILWRERH